MARLIVCEAADRWTIALRRLIREDEIRVYQTRSLKDCERQMSEHPASIVFVEMQDLATCAKWLLVITATGRGSYAVSQWYGSHTLYDVNDTEVFM